MAAVREDGIKNTGSDIEIDPNALAGSEKSVGAQSVRDGRPTTCDDVVEAMDEEGPGITDPIDAEKSKG